MITMYTHEVTINVDNDDYEFDTELLSSRFFERLQVEVPASDGIADTSTITIVDNESGHQIFTDTIDESKFYTSIWQQGVNQSAGSANNRLWSKWYTRGSLKVTIAGAGAGNTCTVRYWLGTGDASRKDI